jgi:hypothetical protein
MVQPLREHAIQSLTARPRRQNGGWPRRSYVLYLVRQQAQAGLFRDGGIVPDEVGDYVRQLRREIEADIALRLGKTE